MIMMDLAAPSSAAPPPRSQPSQSPPPSPSPSPPLPAVAPASAAATGDHDDDDHRDDADAHSFSPSSSFFLSSSTSGKRPTTTTTASTSPSTIRLPLRPARPVESSPLTSVEGISPAAATIFFSSPSSSHSPVHAASSDIINAHTQILFLEVCSVLRATSLNLKQFSLVEFSATKPTLKSYELTDWSLHIQHVMEFCRAAESILTELGAARVLKRRPTKSDQVVVVGTEVTHDTTSDLPPAIKPNNSNFPPSESSYPSAASPGRLHLQDGSSDLNLDTMQDRVFRSGASHTAATDLEINVRVGDYVKVIAPMDDAGATVLGVNLETGATGVFGSGCVTQGEPIPEEEATKRADWAAKIAAVVEVVEAAAAAEVAVVLEDGSLVMNADRQGTTQPPEHQEESVAGDGERVGEGEAAGAVVSGDAPVDETDVVSGDASVPPETADFDVRSILSAASQVYGNDALRSSNQTPASTTDAVIPLPVSPRKRRPGIHVATAAYDSKSVLEADLVAGDIVAVMVWQDDDVALGVHIRTQMESLFLGSLLEYVGEDKYGKEDFGGKTSPVISASPSTVSLPTSPEGSRDQASPFPSGTLPAPGLGLRPSFTTSDKPAAFSLPVNSPLRAPTPSSLIERSTRESSYVSPPVAAPLPWANVSTSSSYAAYRSSPPPQFPRQPTPIPLDGGEPLRRRGHSLDQYRPSPLSLFSSSPSTPPPGSAAELLQVDRYGKRSGLRSPTFDEDLGSPFVVTGSMTPPPPVPPVPLHVRKSLDVSVRSTIWEENVSNESDVSLRQQNPESLADALSGRASTSVVKRQRIPRSRTISNFFTRSRSTSLSKETSLSDSAPPPTEQPPTAGFALPSIWKKSRSPPASAAPFATTVGTRHPPHLQLYPVSAASFSESPDQQQPQQKQPLDESARPLPSRDLGGASDGAATTREAVALPANRSASVSPALPAAKVELSQFVVEEFHATEQRYLALLRLYKKYIIEPIREAKLLSIVDFRIAFKQVEPVMQLAEKMEAYLSEARGKDPGVVAELFLKKINYNEWKVYHDYIRFYQAGRQVLAAMEAKSGPEGDRFRQFVKKLRKDEATEGKTIQEFMMLPIQHITRYGLLLVRLRSYSKEGSDQAEKIKDAENYMREVGNTLERIQTREEGIRAMFQLFYSVENVPVSFVSYSQRRFQGEYAAVDIDGHCLGFGLDPAEGFKKPTGFGLDEAVGGRGGPAGTSAEPAAATVAAGPRRLFLFSDCILVAAGSSTAVLDGAAAGPSSKKLELVARLPFSVITAIEEEDENILRLQCVNGSRLETFRFRLEDAKKRQALALAIQLSLTQQSRQGMGRWWNSG